MIEANEFIPLDIVHHGSILCEELKARRIRQREFARQIGMTTGRLRYLLKGKISSGAHADCGGLGYANESSYWNNCVQKIVLTR